MKDKTLSKNNLDIIKNNMEKIKLIENWNEKIILITETRELIKTQKMQLSKFKNLLNSDIDEDVDFGEINLEKVISKIQKNNNLQKKINNLKLLKLWIKKQKNIVIKKNET